MIESSFIEWLDFGDTAQKIDVYSKNNIIKIFRFFRALNKNKFPIFLEIILMIINFIQLLSITSYFVSSDNDIILEIFNYLKNILFFSEMINNNNTYTYMFYIFLIIILLDIFIMYIILFTIKHINLKILIYITNLINILVYYYLIVPIIDISITSFWCEDNQHKILQIKCFSNMKHLIYIIFCVFFSLSTIFIAILYSIFYNEIGAITSNLNEKIIRINCNYELISLINKIIIVVFCFNLKIIKDNNTLKLIYVALIFIICVVMSLYVYNNVYYYNNMINYITYLGWFFCSWYSLCIVLKSIFTLKNISITIFIGWIIIIISLYKLKKLNEFLLITETNILEFKNIKSVEMYNNILLNQLTNITNNSTKILLYGNIKNVEEYIYNNPELSYHYHKLLNDKYFNKLYNKDIELPILSVIYIIYSTLLEKSLFREEIALYMSYFLINHLKNPTYAILLCSKMKTFNFRSSYHKYLLVEDIKEHLTYKLNSSNKESIKYVQIGSLILYYLYVDLFKIKIYDGISNQIDYFDILRNNINTIKTTDNFLKTANNIIKTRKEVLIIWKKIIEINPFSDELYKDYMLYINTILQDEVLVREESKNYTILKNNKLKEKESVYQSLFLMDTSSVILADGYLSNGKILYASPNFSFTFSYNEKGILNMTIDDLLPNAIQPFHKELIDNAIKYSNMNYIFKNKLNSLLKNKNGGLSNIKLYIKPVPNLNYGLIFFVFMEKIHQSNFTITLDKDLKINGFNEMGGQGSSFTIDGGYNLNRGIYGNHIGLIIPDILPLIEYKDEEFNIIKRDLELKGYLYQINDINEIKPKIDCILEKIKSNNKNNQLQYEDCIQNISENFNDLISDLNKRKIKPYSIFYKIKMFSFLDGKYKYYRVYIIDDIITGNERERVINKENNESKITKNNNVEYRSIISKMSNTKMKRIRKKIKIEKQFEVNNDNLNEKEEIDNSNVEQNNEIEDNDESNRFNDNEEKPKAKKKIISNIESNTIESSLNKIKLDIINKKSIFQIKLIKFLCLIFLIVTSFLIICNEIMVKKHFVNISKTLEYNLYFNITKINVGVVYIIVTNIKWELHSCLMSNNAENFTKLYDDLITKNIGYILKFKNIINNFGEEYKEIVNKNHNIGLNIYGTDKNEEYKFNLDNILYYIINGGINVVKEHVPLLSKSIQTNNLNPLSFGYNELIDLQNITYLYFISDINGFTNEEKSKKLRTYSKNFTLICNSIILLLLLIIYIIYIINIHKIEIYFLGKLIYFNSTNFDNYLKSLEEIKKKLQNDNINEEEEEKDDVDMNELDSKKNTKKEVDEKTEKNGKKSKKKDQNKIGKAHIQKLNKIKIMGNFFIKKNIILGIEIILIMLISLSYYIVSLFLEQSKTMQLLDFDTINDEMIGVFKQSFDIFINFKKQMDHFEDTLNNCQGPEKALYKMIVPKIWDLKIPSFGNNIMKIKSNFNFNNEILSNFSLLFIENACRALSSNEYDYYICETYYNDILLQGMENTVSKIGTFLGTIIEDLNFINNNGTLFREKVNYSKFHTFEIFIEYYYQKSIVLVDEIFSDLRSELTNSIISIIKILLIIYIVVILLLCLTLIYFIYNIQSIITSFLFFIAILPFKYLLEDNDFYNEIILFGNKYF